MPLLPVGHRLAYAMLQKVHDAEDAVQEAALKVWRDADRFRGGSELRPWFLTIVANESRQRRRNRWRAVCKVAVLHAVATPGEQVGAYAGERRSELRRL